MPSPTCINLKSRFGRQFRVTYEESYGAAHGPNARSEDPWLMVIPCRHGHIYPHGGTTLAASVDGHPIVASQLRRLACCRVHQDGDGGELTALFDVADFETVAQVMMPRRRRQVTAEQREELVRRLQRGQHPQQLPIQGASTARGGDFEGQDGQGDVSGPGGPFCPLELP